MPETVVFNNKTDSFYSETTIKIILVITLVPIVAAFMPLFIIKRTTNVFGKASLILSQFCLIAIVANYKYLDSSLPIVLTSSLIYLVPTLVLAIKEVREAPLEVL